MNKTPTGEPPMTRERLAQIQNRYKDSLTTELVREIHRLSDLLYGARCVYCGGIIGVDRKNQGISDDELRRHVTQCELHPVYQLQKKVEKLQAEINMIQAPPTLEEDGTPQHNP